MPCTTTVPYSKFYLFNGDGGNISGTALTWKGGWNNTLSNSNVSVIDPVKIHSPASFKSASETSATNGFKVGVARGVSRSLPAQTISGTLDVILGIVESNADANMYWKVYAYVTVGLTDSVRGVLLDYEDNTVEWPTVSTGTALPSAQTLTSVAISDGDRVVVEFGYVARNTLTSSRTGTIRTGCMTSAEGLTAQSDLTVGSTSTTTLAGSITFSGNIYVYDCDEDHAATAQVLTAPDTINVNLRRFTYDTDGPTPCSGSVGNTHARYNSWYAKWTCPFDQSVTVSADITNAASTFATVLQVMTGTPGSYTVVQCRSENAASLETITFAATAGVTYTFQVATVYYGGGDLVFTFTPETPPELDNESVSAIAVDGVVNGTNFTAMEWVKLPVLEAATHHFFYLGDANQFGANAYVWIGTDTDGVTLKLNIWDGSTLHTYLGSALSIDTWYHIAYVKTGSAHVVYLSTESTPALTLTAAITQTVAISWATGQPDTFFAYGAEDRTIPKAMKVWNAALTTTQITVERQTYRAAFIDPVTPGTKEIVNVTSFRTETENGAGGFTDYSGYDRRFSPAIFGSAPGWNLIKGPRLSTRAQRPYTDSFEGYSGLDYAAGWFGGVTGPVQHWEHATQPTLYTQIKIGAGYNSIQGFSNHHFSGALLWFEHDDFVGRCGKIRAVSYKIPDISPGDGAGVGFQIYNPIKLKDDPNFLFGIANGQFTGASGDLYFFNSYGTPYEETIPDVYSPLVWEEVVMTFRMSTVNNTLDGINADGEVRVTVGGRAVYVKTGLSLTVDDSRWAEGVNTWEGVAYFWGGYIDNARASGECYEQRGLLGPLVWTELTRREP